MAMSLASLLDELGIRPDKKPNSTSSLTTYSPVGAAQNITFQLPVYTDSQMRLELDGESRLNS